VILRGDESHLIPCTVDSYMHSLLVYCHMPTLHSDLLYEVEFVGILGI
jgi:hypothetical protein